MRLHEARAALLSKMTDGRPTMDFPYGDDLLDLHLFAAAAELVKREAQSLGKIFTKLPSWAKVRLECQVITLDNPTCFIPKICETRFRVDLPAKPLGIERPISSVFVSSSMILAEYMPQEMIPYIKYRARPASKKHPVYTLTSDGDAFFIHIFAGTWDLTGCRMTVIYAPGEAISSSPCAEPNTILPHPEGGELQLLELAMQSLLSSENKQADIVSDGVDQTDITR